MTKTHHRDTSYENPNIKNIRMSIAKLVVVSGILAISFGLCQSVQIQAAESTGKWLLVETIVNPDGVTLISDTRTTGFESISESRIGETSIYTQRYYQQYAYDSDPDLINEYSVENIFDIPPVELVVGEPFSLTLQGKLTVRKREQSGGYLGADIGYTYGKEFSLQTTEYAGIFGQNEIPDSEEYGSQRTEVRLTVNEDTPTGFFTGNFIFNENWVQNPDTDQIRFTFESSGYKIIWVYQTTNTLTNDEKADDDGTETQVDIIDSITGSDVTLPDQQESVSHDPAISKASQVPFPPHDTQQSNLIGNVAIFLVLGIVVIVLIAVGMHFLRRNPY